MRTVDQGGQKCPYLDKALLCEVCVQPGAPGPVRAGLQPRQLHAPLRASERGVTLVSLKHPAQTHKDWGQDYQSLPDDHISDGGGCGTREAVPVDAIENPPPGEGLRESARLEPVKDGTESRVDSNAGQLSHDNGKSSDTGGDMERSVGEHATDSSQPSRKGAVRGNITALEAVYE